MSYSDENYGVVWSSIYYYTSSEESYYKNTVYYSRGNYRFQPQRTSAKAFASNEQKAQLSEERGQRGALVHGSCESEFGAKRHSNIKERSAENSDILTDIRRTAAKASIKA